MSKGSTRYLWGGLGFFLLAMVVFIVVGVLAVPRNYVSPPDDTGTLDLSNVEFEDDIVSISPGYYTFYPNQLLSSGEAGAAGASRTEPYGTCRVTLLLPKGVYALSQTTNDFAFETSANGEVIGTLGTVGSSLETSKARAGTLISSFSTDRTSKVEIAFTYSGFVRHYAPPTIYLGSAEQIAQQQERLVLRDMLFAGCMLTAGLLFFGMFLFFGHHRRFLFFSLTCVFLTINQLITRSIPLSLLVPLDAALVARIEYLVTVGLAASLFCYLDAIFGSIFQRWVYLIGGVLLAAYSVFLLVVQPYFFTQVRPAVTVVFAVLALYCLIRIAMEVRRPPLEQQLVLIGFILYIVVVFAEQAVLRWVLPYRYGNGFFPASAMVGMIFLNMVALSVYALRIERELHEARLAEEALQRSNLSLERRTILQQELMQTVSHELRTPLTVMSGYAQLSAKKLREDKPSENIPRDLEVITEESDRLSLLVSRLLEQNIDIHEGAQAACDPAKTIERCGNMYEPMLAQKGNALVLELSCDVDDIAIDQASLTQVLLNLLTNANRHTRNGIIGMGVERKVDTDGSAYGYLWVKDTGEGIDPETQQRVFERYAQGGKGGSRGLGLAICREVIEGHGGLMGIDSTSGEGTCVWIRLPFVSDGRGEDLVE